MEKVDNKEFLWHGLYAFAGFGLELILIMIENMLTKEQNIFTNCLHWTLTSILWGVMGFILYKRSKNKLHFDIRNTEKAEWKNVMILLVLMIAALIMKCFVIGGVKSVMEFKELGVIKFVFQYVYYLFEVILILLTIAFGQRFFEGIGKSANKFIPYGGLFLACTWGLMHILTQDLVTGIYAFAMSVVYGAAYLLLNKNTKYTYLAILLLFVI